MPRILIFMTKARTLELLDGQQHPSGFWVEEFVVPYERFVAAGYDVDIATVGGVPPTPDEGSLLPQVVALTRPAGADGEVRTVEHCREVIDSLDALRHPIDVAHLTRERLEFYAGCYVSGGHGAMADLPHEPDMTRAMRTILELDKPLALICHGQAALLPLRDGHGRWPLEGYRMTGFSHEEELFTDMAGSLPFVLQFELERLGAKYEKSPVPWGSYVVEDRNLVTGQNPHSSTALADAFVQKLAASR